MPQKAWLLQLFRKVHLYFGLLIAPALLFFAFTGAMQTLGYHEASANYKPASWMAVLGQIHKKQTTTLPVRRNAGGEGSHPDASSTRPQPSSPGPLSTGAPGLKAQNLAAAPDSFRAPLRTATAPGINQPPQTLQAKQKQHLPLKLFFVLVSLGLFTSTLTGIYMAYKYDRNTILITAILLAGIVLPLLLLRL